MKKATLMLGVLLIVGVMSAEAAGYRATASGDWNNTGIWNPTSVPGPGDVVEIGGGLTVNVNVDASCASLSLGKSSNPVSGNGNLVINTGRTLTVTSNLEVGLASGEVGTVSFQTAGSGLIVLNGTLNFGNATSKFNGYSAVQRSISGSGTWVFSSPNTRIVTVSQPAQNVTVATYPNTAPPNVTTGAAIQRYYTIFPSGSLTGTLRLAYDVSELNGILEVNLASFRHNGSQWLETGGAPNTTNKYVEVAGVSTWSNWTLGDATNPLPIQLMSFSASVVSSNQVRLDWATLTETNNYGFEVQKSANTPTDYQTIPNSFVPGHGTTLVPQYYSWTDENATPGVWYYRLKQIDLDGTIHYAEGTQVDILTGVGEEEGTPSTYALRQNFPNPFNPSTSIQYALPVTGHVTLKVYNVLGSEVATLVNGVLEAGYHTATWNAANLSSGVYFYQLKAGNFVETKRLTLAK